MRLAIRSIFGPRCSVLGLVFALGLVAFHLFSLTSVTPAGAAGSTLLDGLVGYWTFDEGSGTVAADSSGTGNNGTLINGPTWVPGKIGQALQFDGVDDEVNAGSAASLDDLGPMTVAAWIKPTSLGEGNAGVVVGKSPSGTPGDWRIHFLSDSSIRLYKNTNPVLTTRS